MKYKSIFAILACLCLAGCGDEPPIMSQNHEGETCGNGKEDPGEQCDDMNRNSGDGCNNKCQIESGYECPAFGALCTKTGSGDPQNPDNPKEDEDPCGNGKLDFGEACDDGNHASGDGCSAACKQIEPGYQCPNPGFPCISEKCGNGEVDDGEACDPGKSPIDYLFIQGGCTQYCTFAGYCGDNIVDRDNGEACDSGGIDTSAEYNGCTESCEHGQFYCGDMKRTHQETCDDGNGIAGDGCSEECKVESGWYCPRLGDPCKKIVENPDLANCGNGTLENGEACDDGNKQPGDGCSAACLIETGWRCPDGKDCRQTKCGDGIIEGQETCEDGNDVSGDGCSETCRVETGWVCTEKQVCYAKMCGDGLIAGNEECDDLNTNSGDGCSRFCKREAGYHCDNPGKPCEKDVCGDGKVTGDEVCDEGIARTVGCTDCRKINAGWRCEYPGTSCTNDAECGNGYLEGSETCEETSECCDKCAIQAHCKCNNNGKNCKKGACGNKILEAGEECDDGNLMAGDGCDPFCKREEIFACANDGSCKPICGDGVTVWEAGEECDDGNLISGDGCSSVCTLEDGFECTKYSKDFPDKIQLAATFRDFRAYDASACSGTTDSNNKVDGCITQEEAQKYGGYFAAKHGHPDFERMNVTELNGNIAQATLGTDGLPVFGSSTGQITASSYQMWYRDFPGINRTVKGSLELTCQNKTNGVYVYENGNYFPLNNDPRGYGNHDGQSNDFHFTTHIQTYFRYDGNPATLHFYGDDDVWVFVNGKKAIDLGGCHSQTAGEFTLKGDVHPTTQQKYDPTFSLYEGGIYPISFFQAERHTSASNFKLTLTGFVNMGESLCKAVCGDGLIRGEEECDIAGHIDDETAQKAGCVNCRIKPYCGNNLREGSEECDGGDGCTADCHYANNSCGNGVIDPPETCDDGDKNGTAESKCMANCHSAGCGNGIVEEGEECDDGNDSNEDNCTTLCTRPVCGDGIVQAWLGEVCDDKFNDGSYGRCGLGCSYLPPRCGDAVIDTYNGEECDDGVNDGTYNTCSPECKLTIRCGDGTIQPEYGEECDDGDKNGTVESQCSRYCIFPVN
ncbi:MAG: DUF4215 domain-containing protein [Proteobacteria bacterium]|nr:DUF4215 domain-containing protein [Pseudomonadota bacterium]